MPIIQLAVHPSPQVSGPVAQLGAHYIRIVGVVGSIPIWPTKIGKFLTKLADFQLVKEPLFSLNGIRGFGVFRCKKK